VNNSTKYLNDILQRAELALGLPKLDIGKLIEAQRNNPKAFGQAAQIAADGAESLIGKQRQILEAGLRAASELMRDHKATGSPTEMSSNQTQFAKKTFDVSIKNAHDITGITRESTSGVAQIIRKRLEARPAEIRTATDPASSGAEKLKKA
jgi:phasin family protein